MSTMIERRFPIGVEVGAGGGFFRVWAPSRTRVDVVVEGLAPVTLETESGGYFSAYVPGARAGMRYRYRVDDQEPLFPDPASRFQPEGPHGPSEIVDASPYLWKDSDWKGCSMEHQVI